jgi:hypothetical protein
MRPVWLTAIAGLMSLPASAQSDRDKAFDDIGRSLSEVQRALTNQQLPVGPSWAGAAKVLND